MPDVTEGFAIIINNAKNLKKDKHYTGTEHVVLAMLNSPLSRSGKDLLKFNIPKDVYEDTLNSIPDRIINDFTPNLRAAFNKAQNISLKLHLNFISDEHLLLGILLINDCRAMSIFRRIGVDVEGLYKHVLSSVQLANVTQPKFYADNLKNVNNSDTPPFVNKGKEEQIDADVSFSRENIDLSRNNIKGDISELDDFGYDLTQRARDGKIDPVIGRDDETERIIQVLSRKNKNNPVLVGEAGVGKSAVVEGLALRIADGNVPEILREKIIFSLDLGSMVAGTKYRGEFESRIKKAIDCALSNERIIFFIDEIHNLVGAGSEDNKLDAAEMLKPLLSRGEVSIIGATTSKEYTKYIECNSALERRFQPVYVEEPKEEDAINILRGLKDTYEAHHRVTIQDEALVAAVKLSSRYIQDRFLPDKAIDLIDEAAAQKRLYVTNTPSSLINLEKRLDKIRSEEEYARSNNEPLKVQELIKEAREVKNLIEIEKNKALDKRSENLEEVCASDIKNLISKITKIPVNDLTDSEKDKLLSLKGEIEKRIIGQDTAVDVVVRAIKRSSAKLKDPNRPIGTFIFAGPTGVGKTELAKAIAECVFNNKEALISFDMSEYQDKMAITKLIGAAPGYVGYGEEGLLTDRVRRRPYSVVVFDEIEKAAPELFDLLLQVLDEGRLTDSKGRVVNFKNTIIILTSNVGFSNVQTKTMGFGNFEDQQKEKVEEELKLRFKPEFINRLDEVVVFNKLERKDCKTIVGLFLDDLKKRFIEQNIFVSFESSAIELILDRGFSEVYGARPVKRTVERLVEDLFADELIMGNIQSGDKLYVYAENDEIAYRKE